MGARPQKFSRKRRNNPNRNSGTAAATWVWAYLPRNMLAGLAPNTVAKIWRGDMPYVPQSSAPSDSEGRARAFAAYDGWYTHGPWRRQVLPGASCGIQSAGTKSIWMGLLEQTWSLNHVTG